MNNDPCPKCGNADAEKIAPVTELIPRGLYDKGGMRLIGSRCLNCRHEWKHKE